MGDLTESVQWEAGDEGLEAAGKEGPQGGSSSPR